LSFGPHYNIVSVKVPNKCIHLKSGGQTPSKCQNGDACHLWETQHGQYAGQEWILEQRPMGFIIKSAKDQSKCIHLGSGTGQSNNGDICHLWDIQNGS